MALAWMGVGLSYPSSFRTFRSGAGRESWEKDKGSDMLMPPKRKEELKIG
jgi:hypothetical protein